MKGDMFIKTQETQHNLLSSGTKAGDSRCYLKTPKCSCDCQNPIDSLQGCSFLLDGNKSISITQVKNTL